jgi:hypothetical protein
MQLEFEVDNTVTGGSYNQIMHFWDNQIQLFYIKNGEIYTKIAKIEMGDWNNLQWVRERKLLDNITGVIELQVLSTYSNLIIGVYRRIDNKVYMFSYEY